MKAALLASSIIVASHAVYAAAPTVTVTADAAPGCGEMRGRLAVVHYKPLTLYECYLSPDIATSVLAGGQEKIGPVGGADPAGLDIAKTDNLLVIQPKPSEINRSPNVTFETKNVNDGTIRPYYFLFHVAGYGGVSAIQLVYDDDPVPGRSVKESSAQAQQIQRQQAVVASTLKTAPFYGGTNWAYSCMCDAGAGIQPRISDNGQDTVIEYPGSTPADIVVERLDRDGTEKLGDLPHRETVVNFTPLAIGGPLVIPGVAEYWAIRSDKRIVAMRNDAYHPELNDLRTGTQSPAVVRTVHPTQPPKAQRIAGSQ